MLRTIGVKFSLVLVSGVLIYMLAVLFWGINRGFDLTDEGFYLLLAKHPRQYPLMSYFAFWLACVPHFMASRILDFRYAQILAQILGSTCLAFSYLSALVKLDVLKDRPLLMAGGAFSIIGNLMLFAKFPFSLSYNSLTGMFLFGATALIIYSLRFNKLRCIESLQAAKQNSFAIFSAGVLSGLCFSIKFPSCLVFIVSALALILLLTGRAWRKLTMPYLIGIALACIFMVTVIFDPAECWRTTKFFVTYQAQHHAVHSSLLTTYATSVLAALAHFQLYLIPISILGFLSFFFLARKKESYEQKKWFTMAITLHSAVWCALLLALAKTDCLHHNSLSANAFYVVSVVLFSEVAGFHFGCRRKHPFGWRLIVLHAILLLLPLICAVGTANSLPFQCTIYLGPTFLLLFGLAAILNKQLETKLPTFLTLSVCSILAIFQFYDGFVRHPYNLPNRLNDQTKVVECKNLSGLRLAPNQAQFIETIQERLKTNGFKDEDNIVAFYHLPGLVYALNGNSPGLAWYQPEPAFRDWNKHFLKELRFPNGKKFFLIVEWKLDQSVIEGLGEAGVVFPNDFKLIGSLQDPLLLGTANDVAEGKYLNGRTDIYVLDKK